MKISDVISTRSRAFIVFTLAATAAIYTIIALGLGGDAGTTAAADLGESVIVSVSAALILWVALRFPRGESIRGQWMFIGIGAALFALGDIAWSYYELVLGADVPFPGVPDIFYVAAYVFVAIGIMWAALAFRSLFDVRPQFMLAALIVLISGIALYFGLLADIVGDVESNLSERVLGAFYPLGDLVLELGPALFILLVAMKLGGGRFAWPWRAVAAGFFVLAITDTAFTWLDWNELYASGHIVDAGWMLGYALVGFGASIAADVHLAVQKPAVERKSA